jgi:uncharacterized protein DUF4236
MGWSFRRSISVGPLRLNLGKRGVGVFTGVRGARVGLEPSGRRYFSAGAFGVRYRKSFGQSTQPAQGGSRHAWRPVAVAVAISLFVLFLILRAMR